MDEYIKKSEAVDVIVKYPYNVSGKTATAIKMIEDLQSADVVPKSAVESIITLNSQLEAKVFEQRKEIERLTVELDAMRGAANSLKMHYENAETEIETLKDNNEHLAVMLEEAKAEVGKLQNELVIWKQNRFNLFQRLECYKMARQKVASEIFAELEENLNNLIRYYKEKREYVTEIEYSELEQRYCDIKIRTFEERLLKIADLKKKYTE